MRLWRKRSVAARLCGAALAAGLAGAGAAIEAKADDLKIRSPIIEPGELEFENNFVFGGGKTTVHELEYGFNQWLKLGVEAEFAGDPGHGLHYDAASPEMFIQLTPQGKYWADLGMFVEWENTARQGDPRSLTIGPLLEKEARLFGIDTLHTANVLFTKQTGAAAIGPPGLVAAAQSRLRLDPHFEPGFEYYGIVTLGEHGDAPEHRLGPMFAGHVGFRELGIAAPGGIKYDAAYLRGLNRDAPPNTVRFRAEFEFPL